MNCNSTRYVVGRVESECDSAEHVFDSLFRFILRHQDHFGKTMFDGNPGQILENIRYSQPSDDISACPKSSVLTWRADKALEYIEAEFAEHKYPASSYEQYLVDYAEDIIKAGESIEPVGACLAALLYVSPLPEHIALQSRLGHELFDKLSASKASEFIDILASAVPTQLQGPENDFIRAVNNISRIAPTWDHMKIADLTGPAMKDIRQTDSQLSDKEFFEIYGGDYSKIPADTPIANGFNNLSDTEKNSLVDNDDEPDYVKSFLITNFNKFHQLLQNNALTVYAGLKRANVDQFDKETSNYSSKLSYYNNDIITLNNIFKSVQGISRKHSPELLSDVVDAIVHSYLPALQRFRSTRVYNVSLSSTMASTGLNSMLLGAAAYLPQPFKHVRKHMETEQIESQPRAMEGGVVERRLVNNCGSLFGGDDLTSEFIVPNIHAQDTITTKYFKKLIDIQKEFNGKFIAEYRKFLNIIVNVQENSLKTMELPAVQEFVGQFNKVLIRDGHTVVKLTGVLEKHLNKEYIATCEGLIRVLNHAKLTPFNGLIPILQNIIKLCDNVLKQTSKVKDEYFLAKKSPIDYDTYENLVNRLENTYVKFSKEDSVKIHDSMARLTNFVASKIVPKGSETTYNRLKEYVAKMADRNEAVKRYFNDIMNNNKFHLSQQYSVSANKILKPVIDMSNTLIQENMKAYMWLNEKIDGFEVKDRIKQLKNKTFTEEELNAIANAYVEFNKYIKLNANKLGNKYKNFMRYEPHNVSNFFKCYQLARETIEEIGSVNYLERLYKILGIIDVSSEEWIQFKIGLTNYLALSTIWFDVYKYDDIKDVKGSTIYHTWKHIAKSTPATSYDSLKSLNKYTELKKGRTYELFNSLNDILTCSEGSLFGPIMQHPEGQANVVDTEVIDKNSINLAATYDTQFTEYGTALLEVIENKSIYNDYYTIGYSMRQLKNFDPIGENKSNTFYITVLESLYLPVIQQLDKYIELRYTGTMNIASYTSKLMMMGGDNDDEESDKDGKMKAGSVYDYVDQHFDELPTIYGDAMEFYVSAYGIIKHYFAQLEDIRNQKGNTTLSVEFNERSSFAPLREKTTDEAIKLIKIYANEYNLRAYLKIVNKYWTNAVGDVQTKTTKAIEMICAEFNNLIVFGNINDLRKIRDGSEHEIDLDRQSQYMDRLNRDMDNFILDVQNVMLVTGMNYDQLYREMMSKACRDMASSGDKIGTLKKWLANVDNPKKINDETRRLFIDAFLTPMMVVNDYWKRFFNSITYLPQFMTNQAANQAMMDIWSDDDLRPFTSALLKYSKDSVKTVGDVLDLSLQEYYEDVENTIHHILGFKQFGESTVKLLVDEIHDKFKEAYKGIKEQFNANDYALIRSANIMDYVDVKIPTFGREWIQTNAFNTSGIYSDGSCKLQLGNIDIDTISFTRFVCCALSKISPHKYLPQFFVDALKSSELLNNTFTELRMLGQNTVLGISINTIEGNGSNKNIVPTGCAIVDNITSALLYWSSSQNAVETDVKVASQTYKNNVISIIPLLIYILQKHYNNIREHHENYMIGEHLPKRNERPGEELIEPNITRQIKINAKSEITILINILKALYAEFLPGATSVMFLDTGVIHSDHYLCEVRKMVDDNQFRFRDILANAERFEWLLPFAGIDTGVEYLSNNQQRLTKYYNLIGPVGIDADFTHTFDEVLRVMSKCLLYGVMDSLTYSTKKVNMQMLTGGESGVETAILNAPPADNKPFDEHVVVDLMRANPPVEINNPNGNLIAAKINNSLQKLHTDRSNVGAQGQVLTGNQLFAAKLYEYSKKQGMSMKNLNIELLQKSGILNDYDKLYDKDGNEVVVDEIFIGLDGSEDWANAVDVARIPAEDKKLDIDKKNAQDHSIKYGFKIAKDGDKYVMKYISSIGQVADDTTHAFDAIKQQGGSGDKKLDVMKEILVKTAKDIEYYTSKASLKDYLMYEKICGLLCFPYKNCSLTHDQMNMLRNNLRFDIQRLSFNYLSSECYIPPEERKHTLITTNQFKELAQICLDALKKAQVKMNMTDDNDIINILNTKYLTSANIANDDNIIIHSYETVLKRNINNNDCVDKMEDKCILKNIYNIWRALFNQAEFQDPELVGDIVICNYDADQNQIQAPQIINSNLRYLKVRNGYELTVPPNAHANHNACQKIIETYKNFVNYIAELIQDMIVNWNLSQYQNLFNLYVQETYDLDNSGIERIILCKMTNFDDYIIAHLNEIHLTYLFNNRYDIKRFIDNTLHVKDEQQLQLNMKEFSIFLEQLTNEIERYTAQINRVPPNIPIYFTKACDVLKPLIKMEQNLVTYINKKDAATYGPNYYQMWKFMINASSEDIKTLRNYLICTAAHYESSPIKYDDIQDGYKSIGRASYKLLNTESLTGLHSIYQPNESIGDTLESYVGNDAELIHIINEDGIWCLLMAEIIMRTNFGVFNKALRNMWKSLSIILFQTYVKSSVQYENFKACLDGLKKDLFIIDGDQYYNTQLDIFEINKNDYPNQCEQKDNVFSSQLPLIVRQASYNIQSNFNVGRAAITYIDKVIKPLSSIQSKDVSFPNTINAIQNSTGYAVDAHDSNIREYIACYLSDTRDTNFNKILRSIAADCGASSMSNDEFAMFSNNPEIIHSKQQLTLRIICAASENVNINMHDIEPEFDNLITAVCQYIHKSEYDYMKKVELVSVNEQDAQGNDDVMENILKTVEALIGSNYIEVDENFDFNRIQSIGNILEDVMKNPIPNMSLIVNSLLQLTKANGLILLNSFAHKYKAPIIQELSKLCCSPTQQILLELALKIKANYENQNLRQSISDLTNLNIIFGKREQHTEMMNILGEALYDLNGMITDIINTDITNDASVKDIVNIIENICAIPEFRSVGIYIFLTIFRQVPNQQNVDVDQYLEHLTTGNDFNGRLKDIKALLWDNASNKAVVADDDMKQIRADMHGFIKFFKYIDTRGQCNLVKDAQYRQQPNIHQNDLDELIDDINSCILYYPKFNDWKNIVASLLNSVRNEQVAKDYIDYVNSIVDNVPGVNPPNIADIKALLWDAQANIKVKISEEDLQNILDNLIPDIYILQTWINILNKDNVYINFGEMIIYAYSRCSVIHNTTDNIFKCMVQLLSLSQSSMKNMLDFFIGDVDILKYKLYLLDINLKGLKPSNYPINAHQGAYDYISQEINRLRSKGAANQENSNHFIDMLVHTKNALINGQPQQIAVPIWAHAFNMIQRLCENDWYNENAVIQANAQVIGVRRQQRNLDNAALARKIANKFKLYMFDNRDYKDENNAVNNFDEVKSIMWVGGNYAFRPHQLSIRQWERLSSIIDWLRDVSDVQYDIAVNLMPTVEHIIDIINQIGGNQPIINTNCLDELSRTFMKGNDENWTHAKDAFDIELDNQFKWFIYGNTDMRLLKADIDLTAIWNAKLAEVKAHYQNNIGAIVKQLLCDNIDFTMMSQSILKYITVKSIFKADSEHKISSNRQTRNDFGLSDRNCIRVCNNPSDTGDIASYRNIVSERKSHHDMIVPCCPKERQNGKYISQLYNALEAVINDNIAQHVKNIFTSYLPLQLTFATLFNSFILKSNQYPQLIFAYIQAIVDILKGQQIARNNREKDIINVSISQIYIKDVDIPVFVQNGDDITDIINDAQQASNFKDNFNVLVGDINQLRHLDTFTAKAKYTTIKLISILSATKANAFKYIILILQSLLYFDNTDIILNLIEAASCKDSMTLQEIYQYTVKTFVIDEMLVDNHSAELSDNDYREIANILSELYGINAVDSQSLSGLSKYKCTIVPYLVNNDISNASDELEARQKIAEHIARDISNASDFKRSTIFESINAAVKPITHSYNLFDTDPYFFQNAFVYDPHPSAPKKLAKCYDESFTSLLFRDDNTSRTPNPPDYYLVPVSYQDYRQNIIQTNVPINGQTSSIQSIISNFTNIVMKDIDKSKFKNLNTTGNLVGGDLYTVDSKELLKLYEGQYTIYDSFIPTTSSSLYNLIRAYYLNIILSLNSYFTKSSFVEILYNSKLYHRFFNSFIAAIPDNVPDKLKVLLALIKQTHAGNMVREKVLTNQQVREGYNSQMFEVVENGIEYYEPSAIRRFLEMTFDPLTGNNTNTDKKLLKYIVDCQGDKLIDVIMNFERLNLRVGALFQFIKEFEFVKLGEEVDNAKYTNDYRDIEMFDGNRGSVNA